MSNQRTMISVDELLACALTVEQEAAERYTELAHQMEVHNNREVAELFHKLAAIEAKHISNVVTISEGRELPSPTLWEAPWQDPESPEALAYDEVHYLMTPHQTLSLALAGERRAVAFFAQIVENTPDAEVKRIASRLRDDEQQHVVLLEEWLGRYPEPKDGWDEDLDPPATHE